MFKGIYNVHFAGLQYSAVKIIPTMGKNQAHQSYSFLNSDRFVLISADVVGDSASSGC